jgi:hypothetical protein
VKVCSPKAEHLIHRPHGHSKRACLVVGRIPAERSLFRIERHALWTGNERPDDRAAIRITSDKVVCVQLRRFERYRGGLETITGAWLLLASLVMETDKLSFRFPALAISCLHADGFGTGGIRRPGENARDCIDCHARWATHQFIANGIAFRIGAN